GSYKPPKGIGGTFKGAGVGPSPAYSYQAAVAEVSVDLDTGTLVVDKVTTAHDCGRALNPPNVEGQIEGAAYMGYGEIIGAEQVLDALGKRDNRGVTKKRIGPDGLGGDADPNRALRRLGATTAARERRVAGDGGQSPPTG